jgi:HK97 family phage major capsid protein
MRLKALRQRKADLIAAGKKNLEGDGPLTDEQKTKAAEIEAELAQVNADLAIVERQIEAERAMPSMDIVPAPAPTQAVVEAPTAFKSFGEMLIAVAKANGPGGYVDKRLLAGPTGLNEGIPSDGGFFVQQDMSTELLRKAFNLGQITSRVRHITVQGNGLKINAVLENSRANGSRWGGVQGFWQGEADGMTPAKPQFRQIDLSLKKLTGLAYVTDELLADAAALEGVVMDAFAEEMVFKLEDAIINGLGGGQPLGILKSPALVTVAIEGTQTIANTSTFIAINLAKMWGRMHMRSQPNSVWLINQEIYNKLLTATLGGTSAVSGVFIAPGRFNETPFATIFGQPVIPVEYTAAEGTPGDIILFDPTQYIVIEKGGVNQASSVHVRFTNDETVFRFTARLDGAPIWNSPLTPYKGSATQSPYIVLNTRS